MDFGVGSSVFSQGVASVQLIKDLAYLTSPVVSKFIRVTHKSLPIIFLGLILVILVKGQIIRRFRRCLSTQVKKQ